METTTPSCDLYRRVQVVQVGIREGLAIAQTGSAYVSQLAFLKSAKPRSSVPDTYTKVPGQFRSSFLTGGDHFLMSAVPLPMS